MKKRKCFLLEIFKQKTGWVSGDKFCSSNKSTTTLASTTINTDGEKYKSKKIIDPIKTIKSHSSNLPISQSYTFQILHYSNPTFSYLTYTPPILHSSNHTALPILISSNPTHFQSYSSYHTFFQSYTLPILHPFSLTLFQSYI